MNNCHYQPTHKALSSESPATPLQHLAVSDPQPAKAQPYLRSLGLSCEGLDVRQLWGRDSGVGFGPVVDQDEPEDAPHDAQSPEEVEDGGPPAEEGGRTQPAADGQGEHRAQRKAYEWDFYY